MRKCIFKGGFKSVRSKRIKSFQSCLVKGEGKGDIKGLIEGVKGM